MTANSASAPSSAGVTGRVAVSRKDLIQPKPEVAVGGKHSSGGNMVRSESREWIKMVPVDPNGPPPSPPLPSNTKRSLTLKTYLARFPDWNNRPRLDSLFSQFEKLKETNPFGYEANVNSWRDVILGAARRGLLPSYQPSGASTSEATTSASSTFATSWTSESTYKPACEPTGAAIGVLELDPDLLTTKFQLNGRQPLSLSAVLDEIAQKGDIVRRSEFLPEPGSTWSGWIFHNVVRAPLAWGMRHLSLSSATSTEPLPTLASAGFASQNSSNPGSSSAKGDRETYVIPSLVQEAAAKILALQTELKGLHASDNLMTFADFRQKFSRTALLPVRERLYNGEYKAIGPVIVLTDRDLELVLRYMQRVMNVLVVGKLDPNERSNEVHDYEMVIKFSTKDAVLLKTAPEITQADRGVIELRQACKRLEGRIQNLESEITKLTEKAQVSIRKHKKQQAMSVLKQRKGYQSMLDTCIRSLDTLSALLIKIQLAETDAEIIQAFKLGSTTFGSVLATKDKDGRTILSHDNAEATMDELLEVFADQRQIDETISDGTDALQRTMMGTSDDDELTAELDDLMNQSTTDPNSPVLASKHSTPTSNNSPVMLKQSTFSRPTPIKRSSSPKQGETTVATSPSGSGKRVAMLPKQPEFAAKERKLSQNSVHSMRRNSSDDEFVECSSISSDTEPQIASPSPNEAASGSMMAIDQPAVTSSESRPVQSTQFMSSTPSPIDRSTSPKQSEGSLLAPYSKGSNKHVGMPPGQTETAVKENQSGTGSGDIMKHAVSDDTGARVASPTLEETATPLTMQLDCPVVGTAEDEDEREIQEMLRELDEIDAPQHDLSKDNRLDTPMEDDSTLTKTRHRNKNLAM
ncbi:Snf7-domain-containing protein [Mortierella sp. GBAus27b]|nr:Snf7-domain-containing protein [Mortierella sp. GBAus27b]